MAKGRLHCLTAVEEPIPVQGKLEPVVQAGCVIASGLTPLVVLVIEHASVGERASACKPQTTTRDYFHLINLAVGDNYLRSLADARILVVLTNIAELFLVH